MGSIHNHCLKACVRFCLGCFRKQVHWLVNCFIMEHWMVNFKKWCWEVREEVMQSREITLHVEYVNAITFAKISGGCNCPVCPFLVAALVSCIYLAPRRLPANFWQRNFLLILQCLAYHCPDLSTITQRPFALGSFMGWLGAQFVCGICTGRPSCHRKSLSTVELLVTPIHKRAWQKRARIRKSQTWCSNIQPDREKSLHWKCYRL